MSVAVSMRMGIHLGAGNTDQANVSTRVTIGFGSKYLHCQRNTCQSYQHYIPDTLLPGGILTFPILHFFFQTKELVKPRTENQQAHMPVKKIIYCKFFIFYKLYFSNTVHFFL